MTGCEGGFHAKRSIASRDTSTHVVFKRSSSSVSSSLILLTVPTPPYPNAVYICTADAPARAKSKASAPEEIPPAPMIGIEDGNSVRKTERVFNARGFNGGPERPPASLL